MLDPWFVQALDSGGSCFDQFMVIYQIFTDFDQAIDRLFDQWYLAIS